MRSRFLEYSVRRWDWRECQIENSQLVGIRHGDAVWSGNADFIAKGGILRKRHSDGRRQVESDKAQGGGDVNHFHDLKE